MNKYFSLFFACTLWIAAAPHAAPAEESVADDQALLMVVMDPLSKPLSCDCVRGYAQRDYQLLADHIARSIDRPVDVHWYESLTEAKAELKREPDLVIGKDSVVRVDAGRIGVPMMAVASLSGRDGSTTMRGLIVVRRDDPARSAEDLAGYRLLFGPTDSEEKSSAIEAYLKSQKVAIDSSRKRFNACSEASAALMDLPTDQPFAAVISSYAEPLLEGCGNIKQGDLRVIAKTDPVPFVTAFVRESSSANQRAAIKSALSDAGTDPKLLIGLETLSGFVPYKFDRPTSTQTKSASSDARATSGNRATVGDRAITASKKKPLRD